MKLIHKIILGFLLIILLIWVVDYFAIGTSKKALTKSIEQSTVLLAVKIMDEIDKNITKRIEETRFYTEDYALRKAISESNGKFEKMGDRETYINRKDREWVSVSKETLTPFMQEIISNDLSKHLRKIKRYYEKNYSYPVFSEIFVTNKYGVNVGQTGKTTDYRQDDEKWWQAAKKEHFYLRNIGYDESAEVYSVDFGIRIDDKDGSFIGVMKVVMDIQEIINIITKPELKGIYEGYKRTGTKLLTNDGRLIYSTGDFTFLERISDDLLSHLKKGARGSFLVENSSYGKRQTLISYASSNLKGLEWILLLEYDKREIFAPIQRLKDGMLIISVIVTLFALLIVLFYSRFILKPVTKLRNAAIEIGKGNLDTVIDIKSRDEIGLLAQTFNQMAKSLSREIAEIKKKEKALRESEEKYHSLFEESKDVVSITTPEGKIVDVNPAGIELFGYSSKEEFLKIESAVNLYEDPAIREKLKQEIESYGFVKDYEVAFKRKDGQNIIVILSSTAVRDEEGKIIAYRSIMKDITERKHLEKQLLHAQKMEAVGQLAGGIAHDFNNILTAIRGFGSLLKIETEKDELLYSYADNIVSSAERAANLTQALLAFSRKQIIIPRTVNLNEIIQGIRNILSRLIGEDIELITALTDKELIVMADSSQIEQVLMNLATNARDAMPNGGRLNIATECVKLDDEFIKAHGYGKPASYALISIEDTGHGIDREIRRKIFEPFFTTKDIGKGTGLGLSMVYGIIKQHNGYINLYSKPGIGTTFKIYLPLIKPATKDIKPEQHFNLKGGTETILIAEDDNQVRELTKKLLEGFGYKVIEAKDGDEALILFDKNKKETHLLILDVIMPKKNGKEVYDEIIKVRPDIQAIFTSGYTADMIQHKGILEEGLNFIPKPILRDELLQKVREVLDRKDTK